MWTLLKSGRHAGWPLPLGVLDKYHIVLILAAGEPQNLSATIPICLQRLEGQAQPPVVILSTSLCHQSPFSP